MSKLFSYFNVKRSTRTKVEQPKDMRTWLIHGASEFIGTLLITLGLAGLSTVASGDLTSAGGHRVAENFFGHDALVGFYAGFLVVGFLLFVFLRWSCDLNPAVTLYRWLSGANTSKYAIFKIVIQFAAGILAGMMIYGMGQAHNAHYMGDVVANHAIHLDGVKGILTKDSTGATADVSRAWRAIIIFAAEFVMMMILLFTIFSKSINDKYRDLMIMFIISLDVWMGILTGTAAINPARGLGQQVPGLFWGAHAGNAKDMADLGYATLAMELGTLLAPAGYLFVQGLTEHYINPMVTSIIKYKNRRSDNMRIDSQNDTHPSKKSGKK